MDRERASLFFDRAESFPHDRGYHSQAHSHIIGRPTNDSLLDDTRLYRQGTGDLDGRKSNKKLRYTIPLRHKRKISADEEKGLEEEKEYNSGYFTQWGRRDRENSRGSSAFLPLKLLEIVSTKWVPDDDGREIVTLTTKDGAANPNHASMYCESRWAHIQSEAMTFTRFYDHIMRVPGLEDDDLALVLRLLRKVQKTCEKQYVHGRYLKPLTMVYDGEDPDGGPKVTKTATFVSLPIFTTECPRKHTSTREDELHPVRALLQSRYRLESTKKRDREQVITKSKLHENHDHVVHVPQIWAVIVNKHTIITCAPLDTIALRGDTIKLISYAEAQLDEATWSVQFTDAQGNVSYLPLRYVGSFFSLVKHISDDILNDEYNLIRDQLLKDGPLYKLVTKDDTPVTAESWPKMVEKKKTEVIQLRLIDNQSVSNRLLVTYCDPDGNEIDCPSSSSSDTSSIFSDDYDASDTSDASTQSSADSEVVAPAVKKLRNLQIKLKEANNQNDTKMAEYLRDKRIPVLEERILDSMAEGINLESPEPRPVHRKARIIIPEYEGRSHKSDRWSYDSRPLSPKSKARSGSPFTTRQYEYSRSAHDLSLDRLDSLERPHVIRSRTRSISRPRHNRYDDYDFPDRSYRRSQSRSQALSRPALSRVSSKPALSRSHWDSVRSSVLNGQGLSLRGGQSDPVEDRIYYKPSDKYLARSRWESVRSRVLSGGLLASSDGQAVDKASNKGFAPKALVSGSTASQSLPREHDSPVEPQSPVNSLQSRPTDESAKKEGKKVTFGMRSQEVKPRLKRLIQLAQKEAPSSPRTQPQATAAEVPTPPVVRTTQDIPIFLWSVEHSIIEMSSPPLASASANQQADMLKTPTEELNQIISTSKTEELILHTVTTEVHANLKKPKKVSSNYVALYEKTKSKNLADIATMMDNLNSKTPIIPGAADSSSTVLDRDAALSTKQDIVDAATKILYAFVPEGYEAAVISKYWGAVYKLLNGRDEEVLSFIGLRLADMYVLLRSIQMGVRTDDGSKQARYQIPRALPAAFQHLVISLVIISNIEDWSEYSWSQMQSAFNDCESLLVEGRKQLILMIHTDDFRESAGFQAVDSEALLSLILANLVDNLSTERDFRLTEIYSEYTTSIQSVVRDQASVKVYDDIKLLGEELDVIKMTLEQQQDTLLNFRRTMNVTHGVASLSISVVDRMLETIEQHIDDFDELQIQAETARYLAQQSISLKAESNNKAIIVFTVVTIIFLPLSFVTSYLGMNTSDLRNMKSGQTLFWAIGAPVAFVTLSVALVAAFYGTLTHRFTGRAWRDKDKVE